MSDERKQGQDEVWEAARKIYLEKSIDEASYLFEHCSAQEAIREAKKSIINIGDVIRDFTNSNGDYIAVTRILDNTCYGINADGAYRTVDAGNAVKTGKHHDIQAILDSMKEYK